MGVAAGVAGDGGRVKKYIYFGTDKNGAVLEILQCVSELEPTPAEVNQYWHQAVKMKGLGVPRPTHVGVMDLQELEQSDEVAATPMIEAPIRVQRNGRNDGVVN